MSYQDSEKLGYTISGKSSISVTTPLESLKRELCDHFVLLFKNCPELKTKEMAEQLDISRFDAIAILRYRTEYFSLEKLYLIYYRAEISSFLINNFDSSAINFKIEKERLLDRKCEIASKILEMEPNQIIDVYFGDNSDTESRLANRSVIDNYSIDDLSSVLYIIKKMTSRNKKIAA